MSYQQILDLEDELNQALSDKRNIGKSEFLASKDGVELAKRVACLAEDHAALCQGCKDKRQITLNIKVDMQIKPNYKFEQILSHQNSHICLEDLFNVEISGKLINTDDFNKEFVKDIQRKINNTLFDLCSEVIGLDKGFSQNAETFAEKINVLLADIEECRYHINSNDFLPKKKKGKK
jgi:hypothetical protein